MAAPMDRRRLITAAASPQSGPVRRTAPAPAPGPGRLRRPPLPRRRDRDRDRHRTPRLLHRQQPRGHRQSRRRFPSPTLRLQPGPQHPAHDRHTGATRGHRGDRPVPNRVREGNPGRRRPRRTGTAGQTEGPLQATARPQGPTGIRAGPAAAGSHPGQPHQDPRPNPTDPHRGSATHTQGNVRGAHPGDHDRVGRLGQTGLQAPARGKR